MTEDQSLTEAEREELERIVRELNDGDTFVAQGPAAVLDLRSPLAMKG